MDTPNTRSRARWEAEVELEGDASASNDEGGYVRWAHDQRLRRMMVAATEGVELGLPCPTQQSVFPTRSSTTSEAPSSRPPRKRPCRSHRSLPNQFDSSIASSSTSVGTPLNPRSSSIPSSGGGGLDDLLDRALKTFSAGGLGLGVSLAPSGSRDGILANTSASAASAHSKASAGDGQVRGVVRSEPTRPKLENIESRAKVLQEQSNNAPSPRRMSTRNTPLKSKPNPNPRHIAPNHNAPVQTSPKVEPPLVTRDRPHTANSSAAQTESPSLRRPGARVGMGLPARSRPATSTSSTSQGTRQAFKSPLLNPPTRSSPRRATVLHPTTGGRVTHAQSSSNTSTPARAAAARSSSTSSSTKRPLHCPSHSKGPMPAPHPAAARPGAPPLVGRTAPAPKDAPSSDSIGDESFDSFDGMFQAGGADVEALLRTVDAQV